MDDALGMEEVEAGEQLSRNVATLLYRNRAISVHEGLEVVIHVFEDQHQPCFSDFLLINHINVRQ